MGPLCDSAHQNARCGFVSISELIQYIIVADSMDDPPRVSRGILICDKPACSRNLICIILWGCNPCFTQPKPAGGGPNTFRRNGVRTALGVLGGMGGIGLVSRSYTKNLFEKRPYGRERRSE
nr:MAG TPA: hypothetical protein [Bacteriophage sp.]